MARHREAGLLSADNLKNLVILAGLLGSLWKAFDAGRAADTAHEEAGAATAAARTARTGQKASIDSLRRRVTVLERRLKPGRVYGPEPAPEGYKPVSKGLWWHFTHIGGR